MKNIYWLVLLCIVAMFEINCKSIIKDQNDYLGSYKYSDDVDKYYNLILNSNFTYSFETIMPFSKVNFHDSGIFELKNKSLNFKSNSPKIQQYIKSKDAQQFYFTINIKDEYSNNIIGATCTLIDNNRIHDKGVTNLKGITHFPQLKNSNLLIDYTGYESLNIELENAVDSIVVKLYEYDRISLDGLIGDIDNNKIRIKKMTDEEFEFVKK